MSPRCRRTPEADRGHGVRGDLRPGHPDPPQELVEVTAWDSPENVENRDYLQVERDAWAARRQIGDIPVTVISNEYTAAEIAAAEFSEERPLLRANVGEGSAADW